MLSRLMGKVPGAVGLYQRIAGAITPQGRSSLRILGHRHYVGGKWHELGRLQFSFLVNEGLRPEHHLLDIACGSLRAGIHLIPYLQEGHYMGVEKEAELVARGLKQELGEALTSVKQPFFLINGDFDFGGLPHRPDFAMAQSLFSHLPGDLIARCFANLRPVIEDQGAFYATFFESARPVRNPNSAHDHLMWYYTREEMLAFGEDHGWDAHYMGDWHHPWGQVMVRYRPR